MTRFWHSLTLFAFIAIGADCSREPAIVIRFDPIDLAGRRELVRAEDAAMRADAAMAPHEHALLEASGGKPSPGPAAMGKSEAGKVGAGEIVSGKPVAGTSGRLRTAVATCMTDGDCAVVPEGCCDCANGGGQRAAAKRDEAGLRSAQRAACKEVMCTMMASSDATCGKRAACLAGVCALREARPDEVRGFGAK